jgi:hypothetical protein
MHFDALINSSGGRPVAPRDDRSNPFDARCALHLQRICGTCTHYTGPLRGGSGEAQCARFAVQTRARARAWECKEWVRPSAGCADV